MNRKVSGHLEKYANDILKKLNLSASALNERRRALENFGELWT